MYIQKRDYHILMNKKRLTNSQPKYNSIPLFEYNRDHLLKVYQKQLMTTYLLEI